MATQVGTFENDTLIGIDGEPNILWGDTDGTVFHFTGGNDTLVL